MAERAGTAKKQAKKAQARASKGKAAAATREDRVTELEAECARLKAELADAGVRLEALESQRRQLVDRIEWAVDTLHSLLDE